MLPRDLDSRNLIIIEDSLNSRVRYACGVLEAVWSLRWPCIASSILCIGICTE